MIPPAMTPSTVLTATPIGSPSATPEPRPREPYLRTFVRSKKLMMTLTNDRDNPIEVHLFGAAPKESLTLQDISVQTRDTSGEAWPGGVCGKGMSSGWGTLKPGQSVTTQIFSPVYYSDKIDLGRQIYATVSIHEPGQYSRVIESNRLSVSEVPVSHF